MTTIQLKAAQRLKAATDVKGAVKHVKAILGKHDIGLKSVQARDDDTILVKCKGPNGPIEFELWTIADSKNLDVRFMENVGLAPKEPRFYDADYLYDVDLTKKGADKQLVALQKAFDKAIDQAQVYAEKLEAGYAWVVAFQAALKELGGTMD